NGLPQHARRKAVLHEFPVSDDSRVSSRQLTATRLGIPNSFVVPAVGCGLSAVSFWRHCAVPIHGARMLEAPVNRNPARPPRLKVNLLRPRGVPPVIENVEVLAGKNAPIAFEKRLPQIFRKRFKRAPVVSIVRVDGVVIEPRLNELIIARIVQSALFKTRGWNFVHP